MRWRRNLIKVERQPRSESARPDPIYEASDSNLLPMNPGYHHVRFRAELPAAGLPAAFAVVTACNPDGRTVTDEENHQATEVLRSALTADGHFFFPVTGGSPDFAHREPGFGVLFKSSEQAVSWGRRYQQEAVFWVKEGSVQLVPCDGTDPVDLGSWQTLVEPAAQKPIFHFLGNPHLLHLPKTALFASTSIGPGVSTEDIGKPHARCLQNRSANRSHQECTGEGA